ncbi:hypothetical protein [Paraburkholderia sp. RL17-381-BIF-C]|uniref:hypothetical protein n=1 Tax=Paraburkholderia sp. RL17-381-BIF-C TaxID=3031635 RepID=UPI0038BD0A11
MAKIVCLGWGSLIWNSGNLPLQSDWFGDGPSVQVEFARQSKNGRITLVLDRGAPPVQALWAVMESVNLNAARHALGDREGISPKARGRKIGAWPLHEEPLPGMVLDLPKWAQERDIDGVVWTALSSKFCGEERTPEGKEVVRYLAGLTGETRELAEEYVRKAPRQIDTPYRRMIEAALNWPPI